MCCLPGHLLGRALRATRGGAITEEALKASETIGERRGVSPPVRGGSPPYEEEGKGPTRRYDTGGLRRVAHPPRYGPGLRKPQVAARLLVTLFQIEGDDDIVV